MAKVLQEEFKADRRENITAEMLESIVQRMTVEPELTPSIQDEIKRFAVELQKAGRLPNQPDW